MDSRIRTIKEALLSIGELINFSMHKLTVKVPGCFYFISRLASWWNTVLFQQNKCVYQLIKSMLLLLSFNINIHIYPRLFQHFVVLDLTLFSLASCYDFHSGRRMMNDIHESVKEVKVDIACWSICIVYELMDK